MYSNSKISEREIKETIPFITESKRIKYLGLNLPKEAKDLYSENYKMLMKETEDHTNRWKGIPCYWIGRFSTVKFIWRGQTPQIIKTHDRKKNKVVGVTLPDLKTYYKTTVIKTVQHCQRDRRNTSMEQSKTLVIDPHIHGQVLFEKGVKTIQWKKTVLTKWCWDK